MLGAQLEFCQGRERRSFNRCLGGRLALVTTLRRVTRCPEICRCEGIRYVGMADRDQARAAHPCESHIDADKTRVFAVV